MDNINLLKSSAEKLNIPFICDEPMKKHTSFKIGGNAKLFFSVGNENDLRELLNLCKQSGVRYMIIGNGSNLLISDEGFDGAVIKLCGEFNDITLISDTEIYCKAGVLLSKLCLFALEHSLSGLEFAYGIPGSVGGAVYMNAGAYNGEMKNVVLSCSHIDENGETQTIGADNLDMSYRHSFYSGKNYVITGVTLKLRKGKSDDIKLQMDDYMSRRKSKQPLNYPSAGSVFKRPTGYYAGALIEQAGLKGKQIGGAQVSEKHAGFIINKDNATAEDVCSLVKLIQETVKEKFGVDLECEIKKV